MAVAYYDLINQQEIARKIHEFLQLPPSKTIIMGQQKNIIPYIEKRKYTKKQTANKPFMCDPCGKRFEQKGNLFTHIYKMHTSPSWKKLKCDICSLEYKRPSCYEKHIKTHNLNCSECNQKFSTPLGLTVHLRFKHKIYQTYKCSYCTEEFRSKENLRLHSQICCPDSNVQYKSTLQTNNKLLLRKNCAQESNQPNGNNSSIIKLLPAVTTNDQAINRKSSFDLSKKSNKNKTAICDICSDNFDLNDWLTHMLGHFKYSIMMSHCKICDYTVESISNITNHFFDKHFFDKNHRCHSCSASFGSLTELWSHMTRMHSNLEDNSTTYLPVQCNYCERLFAGQTELRIHQIKTLHCINENPNGFECKLCKEPFVTIYRLLKHLSEHTAS